MASKFKDFGDVEPSAEKDEYLTFGLAGEKFECYPEIPGAVLLRFVGASQDNVASSAQIVNFLTTALVKGDSRRRFEALIDDPERLVSIDKLGEIVNWLIEEYSDRPEKQPER